MAIKGSGPLARRRTWVLLCALAVAAIAAAGFGYYRVESARIRREKADELHAIGSLKIAQITRWREERIQDASILAASPLFRAAVIHSPGSAGLRRQLQDELELVYKQNKIYADVFVVDRDARVLYSVRPTPPQLDNQTILAIRQALTRPTPVLGELYRAHDGLVHLDIATAVRDETGHPMVVVLSTDAAEYLFPTIQSWPTASRTAETLLVRRDGEDVLFLNDLRHRAHTALSLREPLSDARRPAIQAVLGIQGSFLGKDYRWVKVLADLAPVPGTNWYLVSKVDTSEILSELHYRAIVTLLLAAALSLSVTGIAAYSYRTQQAEERQRAAALLSASQENLEEAQRISHIGSWRWNLETDTAEWSEEAYRIFGITPRALTEHGASTLDLIHPDDRERVKQLRIDAMNGTGAYELTYRIVLPDGTEKTVHALAEVVRDANGKPIIAHGTVQDVTERKRMEEALQQRNAELIRFTYTVSHDLKSPLVTIRTFLGFLEQDMRQNDAERVSTDLGHMRRAAEKMALLLDELLELSRVGRKMNLAEDIPLQALVAEAVDLVSGRVAQRGVTIQVTDAPILLHGDRVRLLEVFQNLLDNAVKFMGDQPDPRVDVGVEESGSDIVVFVRDNGLGIDPRHKDKLFGLFEKLHPGTEGTGIGLALIKRIVEVHGGRIWAESAGPGQGATFRFTLAKLKRL
jgi:PAS domain S-box-containing protein